MPVVLKNVGHSFQDTTPLFRGINTTFNEGQTYAVVGPSGSGKSTLLNILSRMLMPSQGEVLFENIDQIRWVFQNPIGVANRTVIDHISLPMLAQGWSRINAECKCMEILQKFNLSELAHSRFGQLSGGESQRLMLARAIASKPSLLLVDEPTSQLDLNTAKTVCDILGNIAQSGTIIIIATHDENVIRTCGEVVELKNYM